MSALARFPRWLRVALLGLNLAAASAVLIANWLQTYPNLIASWVVAAAVAALAIPFGAWLGRRLDTRHGRHHDETRQHITQQLAPIQRSLADLHAKLDRQAGAP